MSVFFISVVFFSPVWINGVESERHRYPRAELLIEAAELVKPEIAKQFTILDLTSSEETGPPTDCQARQPPLSKRTPSKSQ